VAAVVEVRRRVRCELPVQIKGKGEARVEHDRQQRVGVQERALCVARGLDDGGQDAAEGS
jgi:hypothetical protein